MRENVNDENHEEPTLIVQPVAAVIIYHLSLLQKFLQVNLRGSVRMIQANGVWVHGAKTQRPGVLWKARDAQGAPPWLWKWLKGLEPAIRFSLGENSKGSWKNQQVCQAWGSHNSKTFLWGPRCIFTEQLGTAHDTRTAVVGHVLNSLAETVQLWEVLSIREWREKKEKIYPVSHVENVAFMFLGKFGTKSLSW